MAARVASGRKGSSIWTSEDKAEVDRWATARNEKCVDDEVLNYFGMVVKPTVRCCVDLG